MTFLRAMREHFVTPPGEPRPAAHGAFADLGEEPGRACAEPAPRTPPGIAVLSAPADAQPLGAALGLVLARRRRSPAAMVCVWTAASAAVPAWRAPAVPAARRLAAALCGRGHDARPTGRLAVVCLAADPVEAAVQARRAGAVAGQTPTVLALGGPRVGAFDVLLAEQDLVVVATASGTDPALARLALAGLSSGTARSCVCEVPPAHPARTIAAAGLTLLPSVRRALAGPLEALA